MPKFLSQVRFFQPAEAKAGLLYFHLVRAVLSLLVIARVPGEAQKRFKVAAAFCRRVI